MARILLVVAAWLARKFGLLLVIVVVLLLAPPVRELWVIARDFDPDRIATDLVAKTRQSVPAANAPRAEIDRAVQQLQSRLAAKTSELEALKAEKCFLPKCSLVRSARTYPLELEVQLIAAAIDYNKQVKDGTSSCAESDRTSRLLSELRELERGLESSRRLPFPRSREHRDLIDQAKQLESRSPALTQACAAFRKLPPFEAGARSIQGALRDRYRDSLDELGILNRSGSWLRTSVGVILPTALLLLAAIILVPIGVKLASYYVIAPLASRRFGIRLMPDASGDASIASPSAALQRIELDRDSELLVDPALLRSSPDNATKRTRLLLDWSMPITSLVSRLYLLTRIRAPEGGIVAIGSGEDDLGEVAVIEIGEYSALVLQPRCLVGLVQRIDRPMRITRHWRLSLGCWLTLQLRYLVFHGPARLIVRGRRGVALDPARASAAVNQSATLGFSANLDYRVTRCETYFAYHSGKQELFNDSFRGGDGCYVHEVHPKAAGSSLLPGRGIEGLLNSILKIFGI